MSQTPQFRITVRNKVSYNEVSIARDIAQLVQEIWPYLHQFVPGGPFHDLLHRNGTGMEEKPHRRFALSIPGHKKPQKEQLKRPTGVDALQSDLSWYTQGEM